MVKKQGSQWVLFFLMSFSFLLIGAFIFILVNLGVIPSNLWTGNALQIGSAIQMMLMTFALQKRIYHLYQQQVKALDEAKVQTSNLLSRNQQIDKMKSDFLGFMAHEIRTPLMSLLSGAETLKYIQEGPSILLLAEVIVDSGKRLQDLTDDIFYFSSLKEGMEGIDQTCIHLIVMLESVLKDYEAALKESKVDVRVVVDKAINVIGDAEKLKQVFGKIVSNVVKHAPGASLTIYSDPDMIYPNQYEKEYDAEAAFEKLPCLHLGFKDHGIGIDLSKKDHLFKIFSHMHDITHHHSGQGLSLAICKYIVERHGGALWVENNFEEKGCTFHIRLPLYPQTAQIGR